MGLYKGVYDIMRAFDISLPLSSLQALEIDQDYEVETRKRPGCSDRRCVILYLVGRAHSRFRPVQVSEEECSV